MPLSDSAISLAAASLGLDPCSVRAVVEVESKGSGFLPSGRPRILFEGHIFWKELKKRGYDPSTINAPDILFPQWDRSKYLGGEKEWDRLETAMRIQEVAAFCSASWGLFQIMGFNHVACGFASVRDFVDAQSKDEPEQLKAFCAFLRSQGLIRYLAADDWAGFARRYNGPGYAQNQYDVKLRQAFERCKRARS